MKNRTILLIGLSLLIVGIGVAIFFANSGFRVIKQDPTGKVALSSTLLRFTLSDTPTNPDDVKLSINPVVEGSLKLEGNIVSFEPEAAFKERTTYALTVENVLLKDDTSMHKTRHMFQAKYIPYDQLSKEEQDRLRAKTNPHYKTFPVTQHLPKVTAAYKIEYTLPEGESTKLTIIITPLIQQRTSETDQEHQQNLLDIKAQAEQYFTDKGYDLADYKVFYSDPFLMQYTTAFDDYAG